MVHDIRSFLKYGMIVSASMGCYEKIGLKVRETYSGVESFTTSPGFLCVNVSTVSRARFGNWFHGDADDFCGGCRL